MVSINCLAQSSENKYSFFTRFKSNDTSCNGYYTDLANKDIENGHPMLLEIGLPSVVIMRRGHNNDLSFEKKYGVKYEGLGCTTADDRNCLKIYNNTIFKYLDSKYGKKWRRKVNRNTLGLN